MTRKEWKEFRLRGFIISKATACLWLGWININGWRTRDIIRFTAWTLKSEQKTCRNNDFDLNWMVLKYYSHTTSARRHSCTTAWLAKRFFLLLFQPANCSPLTLQPCPRVAPACQPHLPSHTQRNIRIPYAFGGDPHPHSSAIRSHVLDALLSCSLPLTPKPWPTLLSRINANSVSLGTGRWKRMTHTLSFHLNDLIVIHLVYVFLVSSGFSSTTCCCLFHSDFLHFKIGGGGL